jgi:hypothetical protein
MIQRFVAALGRLDEHLQIGAHRRLADEFVQRRRPQRLIASSPRFSDEMRRGAVVKTRVPWPTRPSQPCDQRLHCVCNQQLARPRYKEVGEIRAKFTFEDQGEFITMFDDRRLAGQQSAQHGSNIRLRKFEAALKHPDRLRQCHSADEDGILKRSRIHKQAG